ncbi:MAG: hypothetical protein COB17_06635 [Sulfurimonas sp.]|nr:MAG: hypothetical protein COB17_06635 [Sulfurimonas sp.]
MLHQGMKLKKLENIDNYLLQIKELYTTSIQEKKLFMISCLKRILDDTEDMDIENIFVQIRVTDEITSLPNRESLIRDISALKDEAMLVILHLNHINTLKELNGFEYIKDIIKDKSKQLKNVLFNNEAFLYVLNLYEFAILVPKKNYFDKYFSILKYSIFNNMDKDIHKNIDGTSTVLDFTAGIAYSDSHLFHRADVVLQEAILTKRSYKIYEETQASKDVKKSSLDRLTIYKQALYDGNIIPYFQPVLDAKDESIMKYEALARLQTSDGEIVTPYYFLNSAIEDKTFEYFTRQMMQKVFKVYEKSDIAISINITYENIISPTMIKYIKNRLEKHGGDAITFEIVESEEIKDYKILESFIKMVKKYGCKVSIDDFGSGYSNFTNIVQLDIDYIKIDGTLVEKLNTDKKAYLMVQGLIKYAKDTGIKTIAEFVSTKEISDTVKELGVDYMQGYYYGEPQSAKTYKLI